MIILGIDPGTATTGYGLVTEDEAGRGAVGALRRHHDRAGHPHAGAAAGDPSRAHGCDLPRTCPTRWPWSRCFLAAT